MKYNGHKVMMGSLLCVATDIEIINSETGIKCMAKYHYILERKNKGNNDGHHQAVKNGYGGKRGNVHKV